MVGPSLTLRGALDGYVVDCDGVVVTAPMSWDEAAAELRKLRTARAFAREELFHTLAKKDA